MGTCRFDGSGDKGELRLEGSFTIEHAADLKKALLDALGRFNVLGLDFSGISEADLSFFQLVCAAYRSAEGLGKTLRLSGAVPTHLTDKARAFGLDGACGNWAFKSGGGADA